MAKNKEATRSFSDEHEKSVCKELGAFQTSNSGATVWQKGDCVQKEASLLIECKCSMAEKESFSIKKEWLQKNAQEARETLLDNSCLCFNFGPKTSNYYIIDSKLMQFLVDKLQEEYSDEV